MQTEANIWIPQPPMAFSAKNLIFLENVTSQHGQTASVWKADVKACRYGVSCEVFEGVQFVEYGDVTLIWGLEDEDGYPHGLEGHYEALKQQMFIKFLRSATKEDCLSLGDVCHIFKGHEYSNEGKATAAYMAARGTSARMGIGYFRDSGEFDLIAEDPEEFGWIDNARNTLAFDELGC